MNEKRKILKRIRNSAVIKSPLLFEAVGLFPVVAVALSVKSAVFLSVMTALEMVFCEVLASLLLKNVRRYLRVALYFIFATAMIFPVAILTERFIPYVSVNLGIYLPLMAVNSLVALHCERVAVKNTVKNSFIDAVSSSLSYGIVAVVVGFFREFLGNGTVFGFTVNTPVKFSAFLLPFGGLLLLGFLAAALKAFIALRYPNASPDRAFDTSEIRRSLRGSFKELMGDDFNPYNDEPENDINPEGAFYIKKSKPKKEENAPAEIKIKKKKEKIKKEKPEKIKKKPQKTKNRKNEVTENQTPSNNDAPRRTRTESNDERTYLDDFSEILSELQDYKNRYTDVDGSNDSDDGGDKE